jgi:hypothetical protein
VKIIKSATKTALLSSLLISSFAFASCPFTHTFNVSAPWGNGTIKVLDVKMKEGNSKISAGKTYNPSWIGSFLYYTTFQITEGACDATKPTDLTDREVEVKIGYDDKNYCTLSISDGPLNPAAIKQTNCPGGHVATSLTSTGESISKGESLRDYYITLEKNVIKIPR